MTTDRDRARLRTLADVPAPHVAELAPGRTTLTDRLQGPGAVRVSGIVQRKAERDDNGVAAGADQAVASASSSSGAPLPAAIGEQFASSLGADLSHVRVHTGAASAAAASAVGARAYTVGNDIHFAGGQYAPETAAGKHLLAHEVAHTVQQSSSGATGAQFKLEVSASGDAMELEADRAADAMVAGAPTTVTGHAGAVVQRKSLDDTMEQYEEDYGKAMVDDKVTTIGGHSVVGDKSEADTLIAEIAAQDDGLVKAVDELGSGDKYANCLTENAQTKFLLQKYSTALTESGGALDEFKVAYRFVREDYGHVFGLAAAFMNGKDTGDKSNIEAAASQLPTGKDNPLAKKVGQLEVSDPHGFGKALTEFKAARDGLETTHSAITGRRAGLDTASAGLKEKLYKIQSTTAKAKADDKQKELTTLKASLSDTADTIMKVFEVGTAVMTAVQLQGVDFKAIAGETPDRQGTFFNVGSDKTSTEKLKEGGKGILDKLGGPKKIIEAALLALNAGKIDALSAQISAANEEGNLAAAASEAAGLAKDRAAVTENLTKLAELMETFQKHKDALAAAGDKLAERSQHSGDPRIGAAVRFLTASDKFLVQADIAIAMGKRQQDAGKEAYKHRGDLNDDVHNPATEGADQGGAVQKHWWKAMQSEELNWARKFFSLEKKPKYYYAQKQTVQLQSKGKGSLESGNGSNSAQVDTGKALEELDGQVTKIKGLQSAAQEALGVGAAKANAAIN